MSGILDVYAAAAYPEISYYHDDDDEGGGPVQIISYPRGTL